MNLSNGELTLERDARIGIRIPASDAALLKRICESRGEDLSDFVRRAIRTEMAKLHFLSSMERKALGVKTKGVAQV
jgi:uncharacterized protein (DUF1778 family)